MMTINMTFVQLMVIEPPIAESVMSIYGFQIPFLLEPRTWLHGTISKISPVLTTFPDHILSNPLPYLYFYTSLFSVFSALLSYECNSNSCFNLTTTFSFYLSNYSHFLFLSLKPFQSFGQRTSPSIEISWCPQTSLDYTSLSGCCC